MSVLDRRDVLRLAGGAGLLAGLPVHAAAARTAPTAERLVVVILRGGVDGLSLAPAIGDPVFTDLRRHLAATPSADPFRLDDLFALHGRLTFLHDLWRRKELVLVHAVHTISRNRSHFDAQDLLELGLPQLGSHASGWLNRTLAALTPGDETQQQGFSTGYGTPLILRGPTPVGSWAPRRLPEVPSALLDRLTRLGASDPALQTTLQRGVANARRQRTLLGEDGFADRPVTGNGWDIVQLARATGKLLSEEGGARLATFDIGGWDTHGYQNIALDYRLPLLDKALTALRRGLGDAWAKSAVLVVTEFGRTAVPNGTNGTDHGSAGAALLLGGAVKGGRTVADWPGLENLYEGRDLAPTTDLRSLFKAVLEQHLRIDPARIDDEIFPQSADAPALPALFEA